MCEDSAMSLRVFVGMIGAAIVIGAFWAWDSVTPTVANGYTVVKCGTLHHKGSDEAHNADIKARIGGPSYGYTGAPRELSDKCLEKSNALALPIYGAGAIGLVLLVGACVVRIKNQPTG